MTDPLAVWQVLARRPIFDASPWLKLWVETLRLPDGRVVDDFYTLDMPDFVMVAALTPAGRLVAERHYKHGLGQVVVSLPAGYVEAGEDPAAAAERELLEETGYGGGAWQALGSFGVDGNRGAGRAHLFLARGVEARAAPTGGDLEAKEILLLTPAEFRERIAQGEVAGLPSLSTFLLAQERLREEAT